MVVECALSCYVGFSIIVGAIVHPIPHSLVLQLDHSLTSAVESQPLYVLAVISGVTVAVAYCSAYDSELFRQSSGSPFHHSTRSLYVRRGPHSCVVESHP